MSNVSPNEGARPRAAAVGAAAVFQWRLQWRRRKLRGTLLLGLLPVAFAAFLAVLKLQGSVQTLGTDALSRLLATLYMQILLVVVPLIYGTALVAQEAEARTLPFLLVRPLSRASLLLGKFLGSWAVACMLLCGSFLVAIPLLLGADRFAGAGAWLAHLPRYLFLLCLGALSYGTLFTLVGLLFRRPALVGLFLAFGWEAAIPYLPGWIKNLTVRHHLSALLPPDCLPASLLAAMAPPSVASGVLWLGLGSLVALVAAVHLFARRDYA